MAKRRRQTEAKPDDLNSLQCWVGKRIAEGKSPDEVLAEKRRFEADQMREHGWYAHYVSGHESVPELFNYHTHGFDVTYPGQKDLQIVLRIQPQTAHNLFWEFAERLKKGERFAHGQRCDKIIKKGEVLLFDALDDGRPVLRVIIPDAEGRLEPATMHPDFSVQWADLPTPPTTYFAIISKDGK